MTSQFHRWITLLLMSVTLSLGGCGYNQFQSGNEQVKASWSEVLNQYQRRADLIPNLVQVVKGQANFEQSTLQAVVDARAKATAIQASPELVNDPKRFKNSSKHKKTYRAACHGCWWFQKTIPACRPTKALLTYRLSLRGQKTALLWHATVTSRPLKHIT